MIRTRTRTPRWRSPAVTAQRRGFILRCGPAERRYPIPNEYGRKVACLTAAMGADAL